MSPFYHRQGEMLVPPTAVVGGDEGFVFEFEASNNNNNNNSGYLTKVEAQIERLKSYKL